MKGIEQYLGEGYKDIFTPKELVSFFGEDALQEEDNGIEEGDVEDISAVDDVGEELRYISDYLSDLSDGIDTMDTFHLQSLFLLLTNLLMLLINIMHQVVKKQGKKEAATAIKDLRLKGKSLARTTKTNFIKKLGISEDHAPSAEDLAYDILSDNTDSLDLKNLDDSLRPGEANDVTVNTSEDGAADEVIDLLADHDEEDENEPEEESEDSEDDEDESEEGDPEDLDHTITDAEQKEIDAMYSDVDDNDFDIGGVSSAVPQQRSLPGVFVTNEGKDKSGNEVQASIAKIFQHM